MPTVLDTAVTAGASAGVIKTTLYDLMDAMQDEVEPMDQELVVVCVIDLLRSGRITFLRGTEGLDTMASAFACETYS
jgi:hypothetical protein